MHEYKVKPASGIIGLFLNKTGYSAITMPWKTIYVVSAQINNERLLSHELVHIEQIKKHGPIMFTITYLWYNIKYGYLQNPYEVEARKVSGYPTPY